MNFMEKFTLSFNMPDKSNDMSFACINEKTFRFSNYREEFSNLCNHIKKIPNKVFSKNKGRFNTSIEGEFVSIAGYDYKNSESMETAIAESILQAIELKNSSCQLIIFPNSKNELSIAIDAVISTQFIFTHSKKNRKSIPVNLIIGSKIEKKLASQIADRREKIMKSVILCRTLVDSNADTINPAMLSKTAHDIAKNSNSITTTTYSGSRALKKIHMPLLEAVGRGASKNNKPSFIHMEYNKECKNKNHIVLVGKGVTYDTGGLNIKTGPHMEDMRKDMAGAATVLGIIQAIDNINLNLRVSVLIPTCENSIGPKSYKPGDVYISRSGLAVEIINTDAEGRLILADALDYAREKVCTPESYKIAIATLTGAILVALGDNCTGVFSNSDKLSKLILSSSKIEREEMWRLPLLKNLKKKIKSKRADIKNCGNGKGGSITAALFLEHFVDKKQEWAHLDIAGSSDAPEHPMYRTCASGHGVKTIVNMAEIISKQ